MTRISFSCPSYYCDNCIDENNKPKFVQYSHGRCPFCNKDLIKCDYKSDDFNKDFVCPNCDNGDRMAVKYPETRRYVEPLNLIEDEIKPYFFTELRTASSDVGSKSATPSAIDKLKEMISNDKLRRCTK